MFQEVVGVEISSSPRTNSTPPTLDALQVLRKFPQLRSFIIYFPVSDGTRTAHTLSDLPQLNSLETLSIYYPGDLQDDDVERIVSRIPNLRQWTSLFADKLTNRSVRNLARLNQLETLRLRGATIDDGAADDLKLLTQLEQVDVGGTNVGDQVARVLAGLPRLKDLAIDGKLWIKGPMAMNGTQITASGFEAIARAGKLESLRIGQSTLDNHQLVMLHDLVKLKSVHLISYNLSVDGARHLAAMPGLREVYIEGLLTADPPTLATILNNAGIDVRISLIGQGILAFPAASKRP
jgi:hypothetical protein